MIADLSANHVEKQALLCGFSVERVRHDYGIDLILFTYDATVRIPTANLLGPEAIRVFARYRDRILAQFEGTVIHAE